jgi:outer membrane protein OmpA-like peptidoglycan-associated protein
LAKGDNALPEDEIGYYLDIQQAKLQQVGNTNFTIQRAGKHIIINMPGQLNFEPASSKLSQSAVDVLALIGKVLFEYRKSLIVIEGHTDAKGTPDVNQHLSEQRGLSVAHALVDAGVDHERLVVIGQGASQPVSSNDTAEGRAKNRRVELYLQPVIKHSGKKSE